jgi:hypothetical protein
VWVLKTRRDADLVMASDAVLEQHKDHWLVGETTGALRRTLARLAFLNWLDGRLDRPPTAASTPTRGGVRVREALMRAMRPRAASFFWVPAGKTLLAR